MRIEIAEPQAGWSLLRVADGGDTSLELSFSYTPEDSLEALVEAADAVASGPCERVVVFHEEPDTVDLVLKRVSLDPLVAVAFVRYPDHRRHVLGNTILSLEVAASEFARSVWRAFRQLESRSGAGYEREWRRPFPTRAVSLLGSRLV